MKTFTVKDFIAYNNPCFSCGQNIIFEIGVVNMTTGFPKSELIVLSSGKLTILKPLVTPERIELSLKTTYHNTLQLWVFHKSNKILTSDFSGLTDYLADHKLFLRSRCGSCSTSIDSQYLEFNLSKNFIRTTGLSNETLIFFDNTHMYRIRSSFLDGKSQITITNSDHSSVPFNMEAPLLPLYKFDGKDEILKKLKLYLTFS
jgi:hypothetical protein